MNARACNALVAALISPILFFALIYLILPFGALSSHEMPLLVLLAGAGSYFIYRHLNKRLDDR